MRLLSGAKPTVYFQAGRPWYLVAPLAVSFSLQKQRVIAAQSAKNLLALALRHATVALTLTELAIPISRVDRATDSDDLEALVLRILDLALKVAVDATRAGDQDPSFGKLNRLRTCGPVKAGRGFELIGADSLRRLRRAHLKHPSSAGRIVVQLVRFKFFQRGCDHFGRILRRENPPLGGFFSLVCATQGKRQAGRGGPATNPNVQKTSEPWTGERYVVRRCCRKPLAFRIGFLKLELSPCRVSGESS